jgi:hypothetical protein
MGRTVDLAEKYPNDKTKIFFRWTEEDPDWERQYDK